MVSILLPVYNAGVYLRESVESVLRQTYTSFELLVLDDGSTDGCTDFLTHIKDERVRLIKRKHSYIATLNYGIAIARGKFIARMDADDKMFTTRLEEQVAVLENSSDIVICASYMQRMNGNEVYNSGLYGTIHPFRHFLLLGNFISHPTVMLRTDYLRNNRLRYRQQYIYAEDYKLWTEIACLGGTLYIIPKPLLEYRISEGQVSKLHHRKQLETSGRIRNELLHFLIRNDSHHYTKHLKKLFNACAMLNDSNLLDDEYIYYGYYKIFSRILSENEH
jgi:glycosyltransferase involved in cell wall biosynthesis